MGYLDDVKAARVAERLAQLEAECQEKRSQIEAQVAAEVDASGPEILESLRVKAEQAVAEYERFKSELYPADEANEPAEEIPATAPEGEEGAQG